MCPYFATRALRDEAEIVFCPYNYLIDPKIRRQVTRYIYTTLSAISGWSLFITGLFIDDDQPRGPNYNI